MNPVGCIEEGSGDQPVIESDGNGIGCAFTEPIL